MNRFRFKECSKCQGELVLDEGDWLCVQCGIYYYTGLCRPDALPNWPRGQPDRRYGEAKTAARAAGGPLAGRGACLAVADLLKPTPAAGIQQTAASGSLALRT